LPSVETHGDQIDNAKEIEEDASDRDKKIKAQLEEEGNTFSNLIFIILEL
jgi:hypothetical protein